MAAARTKAERKRKGRDFSIALSEVLSSSQESTLSNFDDCAFTRNGEPGPACSTLLEAVIMWRMADETEGSVLASDAFFPFAWGDSVEIACQAGVKAIAHPGGSMRDQDAVDVCNKYGVALVTTGHRHFRH